MIRSHTPAPWFNGWGKVVDAEGKAICMVTYRKNGYNDLLLAAAPELLAALEWAVDRLDDDPDPDYSAALDAARAVIAKAKGEIE